MSSLSGKIYNTKLIFKKKREKRKKYREERRERKIAEIEQQEKEGNAHEKELSGVAEGRVEKKNPQTMRKNRQRQRKRVIHFSIFPKFWEFGF